MKLVLTGGTSEERFFFDEIQKEFTCGADVSAQQDGTTDVLQLTLRKEDCEGYRAEILAENGSATIAYGSFTDLGRVVSLLASKSLLALKELKEKRAYTAKENKGDSTANVIILKANRQCRDLGMMLDCSRNAVPTVETIKHFAQLAAILGYTYVGLYTEDTFEVNNEPYFGYMRGRLTKKEIKEADDYATKLGIELRPFIQTLAHINQITRYATYQPITDTDDILLIDHPRTMELIRNMLTTIHETYRTKTIHIGMDEAMQVGLGKHLQQYGYEDRLQLMNRHLEAVLEICREFGYTAQIWSDMFFHILFGEGYKNIDPEKLKEVKIPDNVTLGYWDYFATEQSHYEELIDDHLMLTDKLMFAGGAWKWTGFAPHNRFSMTAGAAAMNACKKKKVQDVVITMWGDDGAETPWSACLPALIADAGFMWNDEGGTSLCKLLSGLTLDQFLTLDDVNPYMENDLAHNDAAKYMLFNDPLIGIYDSLVREDMAEQFQKAAEELKEIHTENERYDILFRSGAALAKVLAVKADLGVRLRKAYKTKDVEKLREIGNRMPALINDLETYYDIFHVQWMTEGKSFGFEVQAIRIGGVICRLKDVMQIVLSYVDGDLEQIAELEEELLPYNYESANTYAMETALPDYCLWADVATTGLLRGV